MAINIHPIPAFTDNYIWAINNDNNQQTIIVDPGESEPVIQYLQQQSLSLTAIWVTHHHSDHIGGIKDLAARYPDVPVYAHPNIHHLIDAKQLIAVKEGSEVKAWQHTAQVWQVAGHTAEHLAYLLTIGQQLHIFCGDTLFRAGSGRVFSGTIEELFESFDRFNQLPNDQALFYPAHEYSLSNLNFAQTVEPQNSAIHDAMVHDQALRDKQRPTLPTSLADERRINPFLRAVHQVPDSLIAGVAEQRHEVLSDSFIMFKKLRQLKNNF